MHNGPTVAHYGSWKSPITTDLIVSGAIRLGQIELDGNDVYWVEGRPLEGTRNVVVRRTADGEIHDVTPSPFNVCTRVHEYGGASFAVADGVVVFSNFADQRVYRQDSGGPPRPLTPAGSDLRYADGVIDEGRGRVVCVREDHTVKLGEAVNTLVSLDMEAGGSGDILVSGRDFHSSPTLSPDGARLAWLTWDHPNMPWDGTELWVADLSDDGTLVGQRLVAGGPDESVFQPEWSPGGDLYFVSDRTGWWSLYRLTGNKAEHLTPMKAEFGAPQWSLGTRTYTFDSDRRIICQYNHLGTWTMATLDTKTLELLTIDAPYTEMSRGDIKSAQGRVVFEAGSPTEPTAIVLLNTDTGETEVLRCETEATVDKGYLSAPEAIEFATDNGLTAHAFYYAAYNQEYAGPDFEKPPLMVVSHGGPTGAASTAFSLSYQFWTSRGIAILDVNYGGSTGFGTEYRRRLNGGWGIVDVGDCVNGALFLARRGDVDEDRLIIRGSSAGGYTTLAALTFHDVFRVGSSYYGISDLEALASDTHKFESCYLDSMIGPYPERRELYLERSPIHHVEQLSCPVILFQGLDDKIVPPNQSAMMVEALQKKGLPVAYLPFECEQHGFRRSENIKRALEAELYFYSRVLGFDLSDSVDPVEIDNL
ncbi:prolyl oligopeptidase family serine peptidase [Dehalococcoidia bacterium]|nr:prolyl oligopeptidase family serine peptidase [Dehalococcoidia bacterium]